MKKAYTLIELIIVIAIIVLMAALAVPAFDRYGAKNDLDNKAEEIKLAIETAYQQAKSPPKGANGTQIDIDQSSKTITTSAINCSDDTCASPTTISSSSISMANYFAINNLSSDGINSSDIKIIIKTPNTIILGGETTLTLESTKVTGDSDRKITINLIPSFSVTVD